MVNLSHLLLASFHALAVSSIVYTGIVTAISSSGNFLLISVTDMPNSWPDHEVPKTGAIGVDAIKFIWTLQEQYNSKNVSPAGSIVSHCSAGLGRSSSMVAIAINMSRLLDNYSVNVFTTVHRLSWLFSCYPAWTRCSNLLSLYSGSHS